MSGLLIDISQWFKPYQYQAAMAIIATLLVIFGSDINNAVKKLVAKQHFLIRSFVFVVLCAFGYGMLTIWLTSILASQIGAITAIYRFPVVIGIFLVLGMYAQKQRHI